MKVFLSWSGEKSHKVALVFRDWLPSVIQSLVPYVSSEDIDKGTRWSTDIAKELEDSSFGILCVTKDNLTAPWLTFEAGALSKTMDKSFVVPFLFDIKSSEVDGPILQFQWTTFTEEDVKKLMKTLNKANGDGRLTDEQLEKAYKVWWPTLQTELNKLRSFKEKNKEDKGESPPSSNEILEEILDLTRINQKLLRTPENDIGATLSELSEKLQRSIAILERERHTQRRHSNNIFNASTLERILMSMPSGPSNYFGLHILISSLRDDLPWLYDAGVELLKTLKTSKSMKQKHEAVEEFSKFIEYSYDNPYFREVIMADKTRYSILREIPFMFRHYLDSQLIE